MTEWNLIIVVGFVLTYFPAMWFLGITSTSNLIATEFAWPEAHANIFVPHWAKLWCRFFFITHYFIYILALMLIDWLHGFAVLGVGFLLMTCAKFYIKTYRCVFRRRALAIYRADKTLGKVMLKALRYTRWFN